MLSFSCVQRVNCVGSPDEEARLLEETQLLRQAAIGPLAVRPSSSLMISFLGYDPGKVSGLNAATLFVP